MHGITQPRKIPALSPPSLSIKTKKRTQFVLSLPSEILSLIPNSQQPMSKKHPSLNRFSLFPLLGIFLTTITFCASAKPDTSANRNAEQLKELEHVVYKKVGDRELQAFMIKPKGWKATDRRPAIVLFHGGGWVSGTPAVLIAQARYFASLGMVAILPQYRLIKGAKATPAVCIEDANSAMRWVKKQADTLGIDVKRLAAGGGSAGGHIAAFAGMARGHDAATDDPSISPRPEALILWNPVYDNGPGEYGHQRVGEKFRDFSPAHQISKDDPPTLVMLGTKDPLISVKTAERFRDEMKKVGVRCDTLLYKDQVHGFFNKQPWLDRTNAECGKFIKSLGWLKK